MNEGQRELTMGEALAEASAVLRSAGIDESRREAGSLLAHALKRDRTYILTHAERTLASRDLALFRHYVNRRARREPLQYITGHTEFYGLDFIVTPDVLIPRPETELVVDCALESLRANPAPLLCDVGTGSGCIIVALLNELKNARGVALDKSPAALAVAKLNATRHESLNRLQFVSADLFAALSSAAQFDIIVSNPPYVAEKDLPALQPEVREFEPRIALTPGRDELGVFRRLLADAPQFLRPDGYLVFEAGWNQHAAITELIDARRWTLLEVRRDLQGIPRTFRLQRKI
ncbi:MAG: peptide chain release factor N(5)-glutamine methyltransferase [Pyrinomonadaceae bacterium]|nr:peptide chain release factor N(5)-glutamine methyltransferase [Pyrinomonadaceae bacterium]